MYMDMGKTHTVWHIGWEVGGGRKSGAETVYAHTEKDAEKVVREWLEGKGYHKVKTQVLAVYHYADGEHALFVSRFIA